MKKNKFILTEAEHSSDDDSNNSENENSLQKEDIDFIDNNSPEKGETASFYRNVNILLTPTKKRKQHSTIPIRITPKKKQKRRDDKHINSGEKCCPSTSKTLTKAEEERLSIKKRNDARRKRFYSKRKCRYCDKEFNVNNIKRHEEQNCAEGRKINAALSDLPPASQVQTITTTTTT
ncbi:MAG: hypothetical protein ACRCX2_39275, partial [Paraclostridium sp.]